METRLTNNNKIDNNQECKVIDNNSSRIWVRLDRIQDSNKTSNRIKDSNLTGASNSNRKKEQIKQTPKQ